MGVNTGQYTVKFDEYYVYLTFMLRICYVYPTYMVRKM